MHALERISAISEIIFLCLAESAALHLQPLIFSLSKSTFSLSLHLCAAIYYISPLRTE